VAKIIQISSALSPDIGGPYEVVVAIREYFDSSKTENEIINVGQEIDMRIYNLKSVFGNKYGLSLKLWKSNIKKMIRDSDVIFIHGYYLFSSLVGLLLAKRTTKILLFPHGSLNKYQESKGKGRKYIFRIFMSKLVKYRNVCFMCTGDQEISDVKRQLGNITFRKTLLGSGLENYSLSKKLSLPLQLITISRLHPVKNLELCIELLAKCIKEGQEVKLTIIGGGNENYEEILRNRAKFLGVEEFLILKGFQNRSQITTEIDSSHILLQLSHFENFGIAVAEAISRSTPVLISSYMGISQFVVDNNCGKIADISSVDDVYKQLIWIVKNYNTFLEHSQKASILLNWELIIRDWI
jgi:glycosyltransferase involved in cell wall biosynthesis